VSEEDIQIVTTPGGLAAIAKSELESQLDAAHRYPRRISVWRKEAISLACWNQEVAESCMYSVPRAGKAITGPSVRLAEIMASAYGNMHVGARVTDADDSHVYAQGVAWDIEKNVRITVEVKRSILDKNGRRFNADMITVTGAAACSIALRNAVFRVIPKSYVDDVYNEARRTAVGDAKTLATRREEVVVRLGKLGVPQDRIFPALGVRGIEDIGLEQLETLIGFGTAIKAGDKSIDELFPPIAPPPIPGATVEGPPPEGRRISLNPKKGPKPVDDELVVKLALLDAEWRSQPARDLIATWTPEQRAEVNHWLNSDSADKPEYVRLP
jgi:hypothetical protein